MWRPWVSPLPRRGASLLIPCFCYYGMLQPNPTHAQRPQPTDVRKRVLLNPTRTGCSGPTARTCALTSMAWTIVRCTTGSGCRLRSTCLGRTNLGGMQHRRTSSTGAVEMRRTSSRTSSPYRPLSICPPRLDSHARVWTAERAQCQQSRSVRRCRRGRVRTMARPCLQNDAARAQRAAPPTAKGETIPIPCPATRHPEPLSMCTACKHPHARCALPATSIRCL